MALVGPESQEQLKYFTQRSHDGSCIGKDVELHDKVQDEADATRATFKPVHQWVPPHHARESDARESEVRTTKPHGRVDGGREEPHEARVDGGLCRGWRTTGRSRRRRMHHNTV